MQFAGVLLIFPAFQAYLSGPFVPDAAEKYHPQKSWAYRTARVCSDVDFCHLVCGMLLGLQKLYELFHLVQ
jgi:hypothetical protein